MNFPTNRQRKNHSFTLIELLVVIAIIAILMGILMPVLSNIKSSANKTKCISNLRQIGMGIQLYVNDHDGYLPAVTQTEISPWYSTSGPLPYAIYSYLSLPAPITHTPQYAAVFMCPSFLAQEPAALTSSTVNSNCYLLNASVPILSGSFVCPFGSGAAPPWKVSMLASLTGTNSGSWAISEMDQWDRLSNNTGLPATPVHIGFLGSGTNRGSGYIRNALYFDWHVGQLNAPQNVQW